MGKKPKIVIDPTVITNSQGNGDRTRPVIDPTLVAGVEQGQQQLEIDKYTPYLKTVFLNEGLDEARAKAQTTGDLMKGALGQAASEVVLGTLEGASYMLDFEQHYNHVTGAEKDYTNWFADLMKKGKEAVKEDVAPIYQTKEAQEGVAFGDGTWWASNAPSIASSLSLMIPAAGLTRGISALGKAFKLGELGLTAKGLTMATFSRMAENTMEANQTFESTYAKAKQLGFTEDEAKSKAGQAAANTWNANSALWFIDAFQYGTLFRAAKDAGKGVGLLPTLKEMGKTAIAESAEEVYQSVSGKEAEFEAIKGTSAGFIDRLYKNLQDPETLTAGFFGALGGVAFDVAGRGMTRGERKEDEYRANIKQAVEEGLLKERAQYLGDTVLASKVDDTIFTRIALAHASTNNLDKLKDTLSELKKGDNVDPEVLRKIDKRIEDVDFVDKTIREIKEHSIPTELKDSFLGDKLANRFTANNLELGKRDLENEYQSLVKNGELKTEQLPLKQLHVLKSLGTMAMLTGNKRLAESVAKANEAFKASAGVAYDEKQLKTTVDDKLVEKTAALEILQHKQELLKGRLQKYASPEGVQELISESKAKETQKKVDNTVKKEGVTKEELLNLKKEPLTPEASASVDARLNELAVEKQAGNKADVEALTNVKAPSPEDLQPSVAPEVDTPHPLFDDNGNVHPEYELHPEAVFNPEDHAHPEPTPEDINPEPSPEDLLGLGDSVKKKLTKTVKEETKKTKPAPRQDEAVVKAKVNAGFLSAQYVRTWGAELARKWVGKEQKYVLSPEGYFTEQTYWKKGEEVKASDVFLTDKNGVLVVNTPLVKAGQSVLLKIENDSFVINKNFKPDSTKNNIVNVYWLDENGKQIGDKPLLQLPSADNPALDSEQQAKNMELRKALETNGGSLTRVIQEKSIGQRKISVNKTTKNGLSILEWDYMQDEFQQIPGGAILGYVGPGDKFIFNGARNRANLPNEVIQQLDLIQHDYSTPISNLNGAVLVARMSPNGNYRVESLDTRKLNEAEVAYVANLIKEKKWSDAQKIVYISNPMKTALTTADEKKTNEILSNALRQVDFKLVHSVQLYVDPVTKQEYQTYYDFLKGVLTTTLQGSNTAAKGFDNSYSYVMSNLYFDPHPSDIEVKVDAVAEKIEIKQPAPEVKREISVPAKQPGEKESAAERRKRIREQQKNKQVTVEQFNLISEKELQWFKNNFGEEFLEIAKGVDRFMAENGIESFGTYYNSIVTLAEFSPEGTAYHEAGHFVMDPKNKLITRLQREKILDQASKVYKLQRNEKNDKELEERIMESFETYKLSNGRVLPEVSVARSFFSRLLEYIKRFLGFKTPIEKLFDKIDTPNLSWKERQEIYKNFANIYDPDQIRNKRLPGFASTKVQNEALLSARTRAMNIAFNMSSKVGDAKDALVKNLPQILEAVKKHYSDMANAILSIPEEERTDKQIEQLMVLHAMGVTPEIEGYEDDKGTWESTEVNSIKEDGFQAKLFQSFTNLGFIVKYNEEQDEIEQQASKDHIHDMENTLVNPSSSISERVKLLLHSIPTPNINREGKVEGNKKTILDEDLPLDFRQADAMLTLQLADSLNPYQRLQNLSETNPIAKAFLDKLNATRAAGDTQTFNEVMVKYRRDTVDKKTVLIQSEEFYIPAHETPDGQAGKGTKTITKTIDANRQAVFRTIVADWEANARHVNFITPDGEVSDALAGTVTKRFQELLAQKQEQNSARSFDVYTASKKLQDMLKLMGVNPPDGFWKELTNLNPKLGKKVNQENERFQRFTSLIFGTNSVTVENLIKNLEENPFTTSSDNVLKKIARTSTPYYETSKTGAYLNENGDLEYPINLPSYNSRINNTLKDKTAATAWRIELERDDFYKGNAFLNLVADDSTRGKVQYFRLSAIRTGDRDAKMHNDRNDIDSLLMRFSVYFNNDNTKIPSNTALIPIGTPADKAKTGLFSLPKTKGVQESTQFLFHVLSNTVDNEVVRIKNIRELQNATRVEGNPVPADIKNYNKGNRFFYVDALNNIPNLTADMSKGEASPEEFADAQRMKDQAIADHIENSYKSFLKYLEANDIIRITYKGGEIVGITNKRIPADMISGESPYKTVQAFLREYFNNDTAWRIEMSKVFMGDRAFYKSDQDYAKRAYQLETPGYIGYTEEDTKLTRAIFSSHMKDASAGIQSISTILKGQDKEKVERIAELYKNINKTDAQSLATIHAYRKLAKPLGQWNDNTHEVLYQNAWKHGVSVRYAVQNIITDEAEQKRILAILKNTSIQALKPFQYSQQSVQLPNGKVMIVKNQFKDSITVILPELANVHKGYKDMLDYMTANSVDIMSDAEAVKVGSYGVVDMVWDEAGKHITPALEEWQKRNVKLEDIIFPQMLPDKKKEEVSGTQFHKLIMGDISDDTIYYVDGKKMTGTKLKEEYNNLWVEKLQAGAKALQSKLGLGANFQFSEDPKEKITQFKKLQIVLKEQLDQKDLNENYRDTIQLVLNQLSTIDFANPISFPQLARPFEGVFVKLFNKYITNEKSPGYVGVNSADLSTVITSKDMEGTKVEKTDSLGFIRNEKGHIVEAEIGLPIDFVKSVGLKYGEHISPTGRVLWDKLSREQQKALQFIAYRIPTSNKSSMAPVRVAIITPNTLNNTILVPGEMTKQMGLDFDVDKTNLLRRTIDKEGKVEESTDNSLFDLYWSILTSPAHIAAVLNPLTTERLESIADKYRELGILAEGSTAPFYTVQADTAVESKNREEKAKVGIASRAATAHSVLQVIGTQYIGTQGIAIDLERNNPGLALGNQYADDGVTLISENLGEIQQAALDAAKTPLLALFNITKTLMPAAETLALFGYSLDTISNFFMQPIVKEWSKVYNEANEKDWMVTDKLLTKYPNLKAAYEQAIKHRPTISKAALANNLTSTVGDNVQLDAAVLQQLEVLRGLGKLVSNITNVLSLDTLSDTSSVSALITTREKVENATNPENAIHLSPLVFQLDNEHPEVKRIAAFYKYAITEPLTFASQFFPITTTQYNDARAYVMGSLGISSTNEEAINKITQFTHFYKLQAGNLLNTALKITHPLGEKGGHPASRWSFSNPENAITEYFLKFLRKAKQDVNLKNKVYDEKGRIKNAFLASLRVYPGRKEGDMPTLGVVNATDNNNNEVIGAWSDLLNSSSQEIRVLAHDLARYAITTTGFGYTTNSFVDLIPLEFWKQTGLDRIWKETLSKDIDKEGLLVNFVRNKYKTLERFPELYISDAGKSETIAASGRTYLEKDLNSFFIDQKYAKKVNANLPRFVEVGGRLYEKAPIETQKDKFTIQYRQLQPAGGKNLVEITTDGRFKSQVPAYADISPDPFKTKEDKVTSIKGSKEPVKEVMEKKTVITKAGIPIKANTSFATFDLGDLVGKTASKDKEDAIRKQIIEHPIEAMAPNGERFLVAFDRVTKAMRNLIENHTPNTVVITHNTVFNLIKLWAQRDMPTVLEMTKDKKFREDYANSKDAPHDAPYQLPGLDIFIVRHGETEDNLAGNFRGPNTPLTNKGRTQAEETGKALKKFKPSEIITSGVPRTMETGQIITAVIQGSQDGGTDKITDCNK